MLDRNVDLSVIVTVRDKPQFKAVVTSVISQVLEKPKEFELVVVDYGSTTQKVYDELDAFEPFGHARSIRLLKVSNVPEFNRSKALNIGFRWALGRFVFTLDADVVCPKGYFKALLRKSRPRECIRCYGKESATSTFRKWCGCGIMLIPFDSIFEVTGYDEGFRGYGEEDIDFRSRLERAGCSVVNMYDPAWIHLSHSDAERAQAQFCSRFLKVTNPNRARRMRNTQKGIVKANGPCWGCRPDYAVEHIELK